MFINSPYYNPYQLSRKAVYARNGMVASSNPLAAQAGLEILKKGGNSVDAAIAVASCLTVFEPTSNGIGGDAFALVWYQGKLYGLNASGPAPREISIEKLKEQGYKEMPRYGFIPVTVPGVPAAWQELAERFGQLSLKQSMAPAIAYAANGYPVSPTTALNWGITYNIYRQNLTDREYKEWFRVFAPYNKPPRAGEIWKSEDHARTLQIIADSNAAEFYQGCIAEAIDEFSKEHQGFIRKEDLANYKVQWVKPICINYRGYQVWEIPPNGQGLVCLLALNILKGYDNLHPFNDETVHKQIEAIKLAFIDGLNYITDSAEMKVKVSDLLTDEYAEYRRNMISDYSLMPLAADENNGGTVYFATADCEGNMVSYIQSNYMGFGSGLVVPNTGITLQNRGHTFSLNPGHINSLKPGKRTYHTIIPGFLTKGHHPIGPFGVMGGFMQPQGHLQVITNCIDFGMNPQAALDAPRWQWIKDRIVKVEQRFPHHLIEQLAARGHQIEVEHSPTSFGRGQIIWRNPETGVLAGGTESRTDGVIAAW